MSAYTNASHSTGRALPIGPWRGMLGAICLLFGATRTSAQMLDLSYGLSGMAAITAGDNSMSVTAIALQSDGKLVGLASDFSKFSLVRLLPSGTPDLGFGLNGVATVPGGFGVGGMSIDGAGKITVVRGNFSLVRFNPDGSLDVTFGVGGIASQPPGITAYSSAAITQADGKLVAAGRGGSGYDYPHAVVIRYEADGSPDPTFAGGTYFYSYYGSVALSLAEQPDGKLIVAGALGGGSGGSMWVWRINSNGVLDCTFNDPPEPPPADCNGGSAWQNFHGWGNGFSHADSVALLQDGSLILKGYADSLGFAAVKFDGNGHVDPTFGTGGTLTGGASAGYAFYRDSRDRMLVNGSGGLGLRRLNPDGSWDTTFGLNGNVSAAFSGAADCALIDNRGRALVAGHRIVGSSGELVVARFAQVKSRR